MVWRPLFFCIVAITFVVQPSAATELPSIGEAIGGQVDNLGQNLARARQSKAAFDKQIRSVRGAWRRCDRSCTDASQLDREFGSLLFAKDFFYLTLDRANRVSGGNPDNPFNNRASGIVQGLTAATGGAIDGGIVRQCRGTFMSWTSCVAKRAGSGFAAMMPSRFRRAVQQCTNPQYEHYRRCRDRSELAALPSYRRQEEQRRERGGFELVRERETDAFKVVANTLIYNEPYFIAVLKRHAPQFPKKLVTRRRDLEGAYTGDPGVGFPMPMFGSPPALQCNYKDITTGKSAVLYFWAGQTPQPAMVEGWGDALLPGNPLSFIGPAVNRCPDNPPADMVKAYRSRNDQPVAAVDALSK